MRLKEDCIKLINSIEDDFENRRWIRIALKVVLIAFSVACMLLCLLGLIMLIYKNIDYIIIVVGGIGCIVAGIRSILPKRQSKEIMCQETSTNTLQYDPITLENTYRILRSNICNVIGEIHEVLKLRKPASYSQMDAPIHYDIVANVPVYHFLVAKAGGEIDTYNVTGILQNAIEQKLNNNEVSGITQTVVFYKGQAYPTIMIDKVQDLGNLIQIDVAIASEYYCRYREQRIYNSMNVSNTVHYDKEF